MKLRGIIASCFLDSIITAFCITCYYFHLKMQNSMMSHVLCTIWYALLKLLQAMGDNTPHNLIHYIYTYNKHIVMAIV